jgi:hypothetical protein
VKDKFTTHSDKDKIICPFCDNEHDPWGHDNVDRLDWDNLGDFEFECGDCGRTFKVELKEVIVGWDTQPTDDDTIWDSKEESELLDTIKQ